MVRRLVYGGFLACVVAGLGPVGQAITQELGDADWFCRDFRIRYPALRWVQLRAGELLGPSDAVLTCATGSVVLRSKQRIGDALEWLETPQGVVRTLRERHFFVVRSGGGVSGSSPEVEVLDVAGPVFLSTDRDLISRYGLVESRVPDLSELAARQRDVQRDISRLQWEPLAAGRILGPWDMIWTMEGGRVEIEFLEPRYLILGSFTEVVDSAGNPTGRNRLMSNHYLVMSPPEVRRAEVIKTIGDVRIATNREEVKAFFDRYKIVFADINDFPDLETMMKRAQLWKELLRRPVLE